MLNSEVAVGSRRTLLLLVPRHGVFPCGEERLELGSYLIGLRPTDLLRAGFILEARYAFLGFFDFAHGREGVLPPIGPTFCCAIVCAVSGPVISPCGLLVFEGASEVVGVVVLGGCSADIAFFN